MKKPVEIEFKYRADNISLKAFTEFCLNQPRLEKSLHASGYDYFYQHTHNDGSFCRHRIGPDTNQLTFKRKTTDSNNFVRTEHNLDLNGVTEEQVEALCAEFGYKPNFSLFKNCFVYNYECYTLVYYVCYDLDMKEMGRFVEIEMKEGYPWQSEQQAWDQLLVFEKLCKPLGVSPQSRVKRSLFELYKNE